jgi:transcriptional regulator with XRE-family HTH domain
VDKEKFAKILGANLRTARNRASVTQAKLAKVMGISRPYVTMIEGGQFSTNPIDAHRLLLAANHLGVPLAALYPVPTSDGELAIKPSTKLGRKVVKAIGGVIAGLPGQMIVESSKVVEVYLAELPLDRFSALQAACYQNGLDVVINGSGKGLVLYFAEG